MGQRGMLRFAAEQHIMFWCQGCDSAHGVYVGHGGWAFNGNWDRPTFSPSVLVRSGHYAEGWKQGDACWCTYAAEHPEDEHPFLCHRCHLFVTEGKIQFLADCTHALAGQTLELTMPRHFMDWVIGDEPAGII